MKKREKITSMRLLKEALKINMSVKRWRWRIAAVFSRVDTKKRRVVLVKREIEKSDGKKQVVESQQRRTTHYTAKDYNEDRP